MTLDVVWKSVSPKLIFTEPGKGRWLALGRMRRQVEKCFLRIINPYGGLKEITGSF